MTIKECYEAMGGNYEDILARFRTEERIQKYIIKFLNDKSFESLQTALRDNAMEEAFRASHTLKGVSQNLGFEKLALSASLMTEYLRGEDLTQLNSLFLQLKTDYNLTLSSIKEFQNSIE